MAGVSNCVTTRALRPAPNAVRWPNARAKRARHLGDSSLRWLGLAAFATSLCCATISHAGPLTGDDPAFLEIQAGAFDVRHAHTGIFDVEYRSSYKILGVAKPMVGMFGTAKGATYEYGGFALDLYFGRRWVATWSEAIGAYDHGNDVKLGAVPEFRSAIDIAYRFDDRSRLGVEFHHISNAGIGSENPGSETVLMTYAYPLTKLKEQLFGK